MNRKLHTVSWERGSNFQQPVPRHRFKITMNSPDMRCVDYHWNDNSKIYKQNPKIQSQQITCSHIP